MNATSKCLEWHEGELWQNIHIWVNYPFNYQNGVVLNTALQASPVFMLVENWRKRFCMKAKQFYCIMFDILSTRHFCRQSIWKTYSLFQFCPLYSADDSAITQSSSQQPKPAVMIQFISQNINPPLSCWTADIIRLDDTAIRDHSEYWASITEFTQAVHSWTTARWTAFDAELHDFLSRTQSRHVRMQASSHWINEFDL